MFRQSHFSTTLGSLLVYCVIILLLVVPTASSSAQSGPTQIHVNYPEVKEVGDALQLNIYFTLTDELEQAIDEPIQSANLMIDDSPPVTANVAAPESPLYIVLVLDASGSMENADDDMRDAALKFVNEIADTQDAYFSVIRFNQSVELIEDFTSDRNRVRNAIGKVSAVSGSGTCLYDAAYAAVQQLSASNAPQSRRAALVFTDGKDEVSSGEVCSQRTSDEVTALAASTVRVPIHTVGLQTNRLDETALENLANSTGGFLALGDQAQLTDMFRQITAGLSRQWVASATIHPTPGNHQATLSLKLENGTFIHTSTEFFSPGDYYVPPTPTPAPAMSPTPTPVEVEITAVTVDPAAGNFVVEAAVQGETDGSGNPVVSEYLLEVFDSKNIKRLELPPLAAPLSDQNPIHISIGDLPSDSYLIRLNALSARREYLSRSDYRITYEAPATPTPIPTWTPVPVGAAIDSISYLEDTSALVVRLSLQSPDRIQQFRITLVNKRTGFLVGEYIKPTAPEIQLPVESLEPDDYILTVFALGPNGEMFTQSEKDLIHSPEPTPTPVVTETPTPTVISITIAAIEKSDTEFLINMSVANDQDVARYRIEFIDQQTKLRAKELVSDLPLDNVLRVPLEGLAGDYRVVVSALDRDNRVLTQAEHEVSYTPPPTATPESTPTVRAPVAVITSVRNVDDFFEIGVELQNSDLLSRLKVEFIDTTTHLMVKELYASVPEDNVVKVPLSDLPGGEYDITVYALNAQNDVENSSSVRVKYTPPPPATLTPTPSPTPEPAPLSFTDRVTSEDNRPIVFGTIGVIVIALILLMVGLVMRPERKSTSAGFLDDLTGEQPIHMIDSDSPSIPGDPANGASSDPYVVSDPDATSAVPQMLVPDATLYVEASRDKEVTEQNYTITSVPFVIGRKGMDLDLDGDNNISRRHAEILYEGNTFFIRDMYSRHGTQVDNTPIGANTMMPIYDGALIQLGTTTTLVFHTGSVDERTSGVIIPDDDTNYGG